MEGMDRYSVLFDSFEYSMGHWTELKWIMKIKGICFHFQIKWNTVYNSDFISIITLVLIMTITMTININNAKNEVFSYSMCWHKGEKVQKPQDLHTMSSYLKVKGSVAELHLQRQSLWNSYSMTVAWLPLPFLLVTVTFQKNVYSVHRVHFAQIAE